ncbi:hypothetical protein GCM10008014_34620 [Paenibacillus silvae]|uniref:Uncharacterized protein n=1 Tax=Paenibacillus silvae TaxID=1325358 RepID=A0ABQ1ZGP4_9BACL|nr:hypothetical protein [Paenibacillus silvae]GGH60258.1 hypothetical protein GCM10008014_34620 [Paenibacillus silvae]
MGFHSKKDREFKPDTLSIEMRIETRKTYKNITRVKGRMVPIVDWRLLIYINENKLDEDEVFVVEEFFESLLSPGIYPLFTCTCGIFGCGGYYVEVVHDADRIIWLTEQSPFNNQTIKSSNKFIFSRDQIFEFSRELIQKFEHLKSIMDANELELNFDIERYSRIATEHWRKKDKL